ncbi:hypothetical protein PACTADRAFT_76029 [Pachysolen tannophilus NRRL Y-2460]|uniref:Rab-GAP TBC domain-containing protein n=1 Tax=Pachysolen tannophilus NRRL Y-2460 TaxID=669874 RepID=A0A1E4TUW5_PACTA|nr:hypothetical protein PACTADRAFT_76029 [Pachysolen tannophilus NRRL Y-2460]
MGKKKGYQQPITEMSQTSEYIFGSENHSTSSYASSSMPSFLRSLTSSSHSGSHGGNSSNNHHHHHHHLGSNSGGNNSMTTSDQFETSDKVIGASYSLFDIGNTTTNNGSSLSLHRKPRSSDVVYSPRNSDVSPGRKSTSSVTSSTFRYLNSSSPRISNNNNNIINSSNGSSKSKRNINKDFSSIDDDADWDDKIDIDETLRSFHNNDNQNNTKKNNDEIKYPNIGDLDKPVLINRNLEEESEVESIVDEEEFEETQNDLKPNLDDILNDPSMIVHYVKDPDPINAKDPNSKFNKFVKLIKADSIDLNALKELSWNGIPNELRPIVWQLLLGYLPSNISRRSSTLIRKRKEYVDNVAQVFNGGTEKDQTIWHQIEIDIPRTNPHIKLYSFEQTQRSLERVLYLWAIRHPASGYVQGINDLSTPIYQVFLSLYLNNKKINVENFDPINLSKDITNAIEADTFWCLTKILDTIQDNYIHEQPGILRQVSDLKNLTSRIDQSLTKHIEEQGLQFIQFSFRWMNCLLMREFANIHLIIRMWDTYIAEYPSGFNEFHVYVCCAFLMKFSEEIKDMEFQDIIMYLQNQDKTNFWKEKDVEMILSEAYIWQSLYKNASAHLR